jgi:hypothetical protein
MIWNQRPLNIMYNISNRLNPLNLWYDSLMHEEACTYFVTLIPFSTEKCVYLPAGSLPPLSYLTPCTCSKSYLYFDTRYCCASVRDVAKSWSPKIHIRFSENTLLWWFDILVCVCVSIYACLCMWWKICFLQQNNTLYSKAYISVWFRVRPVKYLCLIY